MGDSEPGRVKLVVREVAAALGVLSLLLLAIAHQPIDTGGRDFYRLADSSIPVICGLGALEDEQNLFYSGCDACRISDGISLPDSVCSPGERIGFFEQIEIFDIDAIKPFHNVRQFNFARAPPIFV